MNFLTWYGIGVATIFITFLQQTWRDNGLQSGLQEMYDTFVKRGDWVSTMLLLLLALGGPLLIVAIIYFVTRNWLDSLPVDDDGNRDYPWTKD